MEEVRVIFHGCVVRQQSFPKLRVENFHSLGIDFPEGGGSKLLHNVCVYQYARRRISETFVSTTIKISNLASFGILSEI